MTGNAGELLGGKAKQEMLKRAEKTEVKKTLVKVSTSNLSRQEHLTFRQKKGRKGGRGLPVVLKKRPPRHGRGGQWESFLSDRKTREEKSDGHSRDNGR